MNISKEFLKSRRASLPKHVAIIMDGNGRWAASRGLPRHEGHKEGAERIEPILELCREIGISTLTLFAFSTENWQRPPVEVAAIMMLLERYIDTQTSRLKSNRVRLRFLGSPEKLSDSLKQKMARAEETTTEGHEFTLNVCINYGGRDELLHAVRQVAEDVRGNALDPAEISGDTLSERLYTSGLPDPDLLIRTGGERRISNFLLWQIAYAEIVFHNKLWPDFMPEDFMECLGDYITRDRRFGAAPGQSRTVRLLDGIESPADLKALPARDLDALAAEMRAEIVARVAANGGHLASNLGIVELTIALHRVFDSPRDRLIWDVGHQCYPHKLLTGRGRAFASLRERDGISGFPRRSESEHDCFDTGHGSTSLSAALGMAAGRDITGGDFHVVGICGDGAMTGGMIFEALNHAGEIGGNLIVVLNDNSFSISPVTGALGRYLWKLRTSAPYMSVYQKMHDLKESRSGIFGTISFLSSPVRRLAKYFAFKKGIIFEELGFTYVGPVDGHSIRELSGVLEKVKKVKGPVLVHVLTKKGKGYEPAEIDPAAYHGMSGAECTPQDEKIDIRPGVTFTRAFCDSMDRLCAKDGRIIGITAAMSHGTGLQKLMEKYPGRFFDAGMAEPHAVTFAAGLAAQGLRPVVAIYSTFLQRAYDQIFHDVCLQGLPVVFALDRAGFVSRYGRTHQGLLDIAYLRHMPGMTLLAPRDTIELDAMIEFAMTLDGPSAIRYPGVEDSGAVRVGFRPPVEKGRAEMMRDGSHAALWAVGPMAERAIKAASILARQGVEARVMNARFVVPVDTQAIEKCAADGITELFTIEDHLLDSGFGGILLETVNRMGMEGVRVTRLGAPTCMVPDDDRDALLADAGLSCAAIADRVLDRLKAARQESREAR